MFTVFCCQTSIWKSFNHQSFLYGRRLLDKQERMEAIAASVEDASQRDEILNTITPSEQEQIIKVRRTIQMLVFYYLSLHIVITILYLNIHVRVPVFFSYSTETTLSNWIRLDLHKASWFYHPLQKIITKMIIKSTKLVFYITEDSFFIFMKL